MPLLLCVASLTGLAFVTARAATNPQFDLDARLPFGPFLAIGTLIGWLAMVLQQE